MINDGLVRSFLGLVKNSNGVFARCEDENEGNKGTDFKRYCR